jgi:hypothetical protein
MEDELIFYGKQEKRVGSSYQTSHPLGRSNQNQLERTLRKKTYSQHVVLEVIKKIRARNKVPIYTLRDLNM